MSRIRLVFKNISWMTISQVVNNAGAFFWTIIIANYLGVEQYGVISFATSFIGLAMILIDFGITTYVTREVARDRNSVGEYVDLSLSLKVLLSVVVFLISLILLELWGCDGTTIVVTMIYVTEMVLMSFTLFLCGIFQAYEKLKYQSIGCLINCGLLILSVLLAIFFDWGIFAIASAYVVGYIGYLGFVTVMYRRYFPMPSFKVNFGKWMDMIRKSLPFGLSNLFSTIYFFLNTVMLARMAGDYEAGIYKSAFNIIMVFMDLFTVYQFVLFPVISRFFVYQKELVQKCLQKSMQYLLALTLPVCVGIFIYAKPLIELIYNDSYGEAVNVLKISVWTVAILFLNGVMMLVLNAINLEFRVTLIYLVGTGVNGLLNLILIPKYFTNGSAVATLLSVLLIFSCLFVEIVKTEFRMHMDLFWNVIKIAVASGSMGMLLYVTQLPIWIGFFVGAFVYGVMFLGMQIVDETDIKIWKQLISGKEWKNDRAENNGR